MARIELASQRWQRRALPLCYTCGSAACAVKVPLLLTITSVADAGPYGGCVTNTAAIWWRRWVLPPRVQPCKGRLRPSGIPKKKLVLPEGLEPSHARVKAGCCATTALGAKKAGVLPLDDQPQRIGDQSVLVIRLSWIRTSIARFVSPERLELSTAWVRTKCCATTASETKRSF